MSLCLARDSSLTDLAGMVDTKADFANYSSNTSLVRPHLNKFYASFQQFYENFQPIYKYLCLILCVSGIVANGVTILVLSRPQMKSTANRILTLIAIFDLVLMISYLTYLIHSQFLTFECEADGLSFSWMCFYLTHANLSIFCKACSLYSAVVLAAYRRQLLANPKSTIATNNSTAAMSSLDNIVTKMLTACFTGVLIFCCPVFVNYTVVEEKVPPDAAGSCPNGTLLIYSIKPNDFADRYNCLLTKFNFWVIGLIFKFVPCLIITFCLLWIIVLMIRRSKRRQRQFQLKTNLKRKNSLANAHRATWILTLILALTLICELPCATVYVLAGIFDKNFFQYVYRNLGDFFDTLSLLNGITTFTLYCFMSAGFRQTFRSLFLPCQTVVKLPVMSSLFSGKGSSV